jgi:hypothetical protein
MRIDHVILATDDLDAAEIGGDAQRLAHWLDGADLGVRVVPGPPAVRAIGLGDTTFKP